ncbi:hypothetical protein Pmar_PMAR005323, partial [Perkinsus marinus ATCC 50983]
AILEARKRRAERKEAEAATALGPRADDDGVDNGDEEVYPRTSIYDPLGPPIEVPTASKPSGVWSKLRFW